MPRALTLKYFFSDTNHSPPLWSFPSWLFLASPSSSLYWSKVPSVFIYWSVCSPLHPTDSDQSFCPSSSDNFTWCLASILFVPLNKHCNWYTARVSVHVMSFSTFVVILLKLHDWGLHRWRIYISEALFNLPESESAKFNLSCRMFS